MGTACSYLRYAALRTPVWYSEGRWGSRRASSGHATTNDGAGDGEEGICLQRVDERLLLWGCGCERFLVGRTLDPVSEVQMMANTTVCT